MKLGLNLLLVTLHPMKPGATLMNSFLFNTALVLLATTAAIQFCQSAFAVYANQTAIGAIYGNEVCALPQHCMPQARTLKASGRDVVVLKPGWHGRPWGMVAHTVHKAA